jgi:hypothetical protein
MALFTSPLGDKELDWLGLYQKLPFFISHWFPDQIAAEISMTLACHS